MFKYILLALGIAATAWFIIAQRNSVKTTYVNGLAAYNHLPGREYIFERDCYIFHFKDRSSAWPLVGTNLVVPDLPAVVSPKNIGADLPGVRILDVVRVGTRFRIASVRRDESRRGTTLTLEILFVDEAERKYPRLDTYWILDRRGETADQAPVIREDFAVARVML